LPVLYSLASSLLFVLLLPFLAVHRKLRGNFRLRLALYPAGLIPPKQRPRVWWHGASSGDILSLEPVLREFRSLAPDAECIVTCMTNEGIALARRRFPDMLVLPVPFDMPLSVGRAVRELQPDVLILEYAEIWPELIRSVRASGGRIALINGHLAERHLRAYRWQFRIFGNTLRFFDLLQLRDSTECARAIALGADPDRVVPAGNAKVDALAAPSQGSASASPLAQSIASLNSRRLWVAGSVHLGEEALLATTFVLLRKSIPDLRLLVAPRYLERSQPIVERFKRLGFRTDRRSQTAGAADADVVVLDTMGELRDAYSLATLAFVGGSFVRRGGQNILEPAAAGVPVVFGPQMQNFEDAVRLLVGRGGFQVETPEALIAICRRLLSDDALRLEAGAQAKAAVESARGAARRQAGALDALLGVHAA